MADLERVRYRKFFVVWTASWFPQSRSDDTDFDADSHLQFWNPNNVLDWTDLRWLAI